MIRIFFNTDKKILILFVFGLITTMYSYAQRDASNHLDIADNDTVYLEEPDGRQWYGLSGAVFKAVDPRYIANVYGITFLGTSKKKTFQLISFETSSVPNYKEISVLSSLNVPRKWNYYINDTILFYYSRIVVSALMLQSFEKVEYNPSDTLMSLPARLPLEEHHEYRSVGGSIHVYTRYISKSVINDSTTLYLLNGKVITRKIYEALNPVYIRSLKRITNRAELAKYGQHKDIKEIVEVELFEKMFLTKSLPGSEEVVIVPFGCDGCQVYVVDNIQIDENIYDALNRYFFKEICTILEFDKEFAPYRNLFKKEILQKKNGGKIKQVTVITL